MSLPSTPPAALISCLASSRLVDDAGPTYANEPVSGNRPAARKVPELLAPDVPESDAVPELPHPASAITAAATAAVSVTMIFLLLVINHHFLSKPLRAVM